MTRIGESVGAIVLVVLAVIGWKMGVTQQTYAAVPDGPPGFTSTSYSGSWIMAASVCVLLAVLLAIDVIRRSVADSSHTR